MATASAPTLATGLSNGITVLKIVTSAPHPLAAGAIAQASGLSKATTYRLLRTLAHHELVMETADGRYLAGPGLAPLAAATQRTFRQLVGPLLRNLADETGKTAFVAVQDEDECVTLLSAIPTGFTTSIAQAPGTRHSITDGAPGKAILSITPETSWPADSQRPSLASEIETVWRQGFAISHNEVLPGVSSIAVPFQIPGERPCALALLCTDQQQDHMPLVDTLREVAQAIENRA